MDFVNSDAYTNSAMGLGSLNLKDRHRFDLNSVNSDFCTYRGCQV